MAMHTYYNLEEQFDETILFISRYYYFIEYILRPAQTFKVGILIATKEITHEETRLVRDEIWSLRNFVGAKKVYSALTPEKMKKTRFYRDMTAEYPIDAISKSVQERFPDHDFGKIKRLYESRKYRIALTDWKYLAVIGVIVPILFESVPEYIVKRFGITLETYQTFTFFALSVAVIILLYQIIIDYFKYKSYIDQYEFVLRILDYLDIKTSSR